MEEKREQLLKIVDQIEILDKKRHEIDMERRKIIDRTIVIHAEKMLEIATVKDDKGKPIYSNEELRKAALTIKLNQDVEYQKLKDMRRELDDRESPTIIERNSLMDKKIILMLELGIITPPSTDISNII